MLVSWYLSRAAVSVAARCGCVGSLRSLFWFMGEKQCWHLSVLELMINVSMRYEQKENVCA